MSRCRTKLKAASEELATAKTALKAAEKEEKDGSVQLQQAIAQRQELEEVLSGSLQTLMDDAWKDGEEKPLVAKVCAAALTHDLEASVRAALPSCLAKRDRGPFDTTVLKAAESELRSKLVSLSKAAEAAEASFPGQKAAVEGAKVALESASAAPSQAARDLCAAQDILSKAAATLKAAKATAAKAEPELNEARTARDEKQKELDEFNGSVNTFDLLRDQKQAAADSGHVAPAEGEGAAAPETAEAAAAVEA